MSLFSLNEKVFLAKKSQETLGNAVTGERSSHVNNYMIFVVAILVWECVSFLLISQWENAGLGSCFALYKWNSFRWEHLNKNKWVRKSLKTTAKAVLCQAWASLLLESSSARVHKVGSQPSSCSWLCHLSSMKWKTPRRKLCQFGLLMAVPSSSLGCLCSFCYFAGILINSALKWQKLSLALKSGQLGAVRTHTDFPVTLYMCPVCSRGSTHPLPSGNPLLFRSKCLSLVLGVFCKACSLRFLLVWA